MWKVCYTVWLLNFSSKYTLYYKSVVVHSSEDVPYTNKIFDVFLLISWLLVASVRPVNISPYQWTKCSFSKKYHCDEVVFVHVLVLLIIFTSLDKKPPEEQLLPTLCIPLQTIVLHIADIFLVLIDMTITVQCTAVTGTVTQHINYWLTLSETRETGEFYLDPSDTRWL